MTQGKRLKTIINFFVIMLALVSNSRAGSDFKTIDTQQLHRMVVDNAYRLEGGKGKDFTIIDARTKEEYEKDHVFSAVSIPENDFEEASRLLPKAKGALLIVYGNDAKTNAGTKWADKAASAGYLNVVVYREGFRTWKDSKMPVAP